MKLRQIIQFIDKNWIHKFTKPNIIRHIKRLPIYILMGFLLFIYLILKVIEKIIVGAYSRGKVLRYGILSACYRCSYQKSHEPILIYSMKRGPRVIVNYKGKTYVRRNDCIGFSKCGKCFEQLEKKDPNLLCSWKEI